MTTNAGNITHIVVPFFTISNVILLHVAISGQHTYFMHSLEQCHNVYTSTILILFSLSCFLFTNHSKITIVLAGVANNIIPHHYTWFHFGTCIPCFHTELLRCN